MTEQMPNPPYPAPESGPLRVIVANALRSIEAGEATVDEAVLHAAVHGWYEGHIEGEDVCPGCDYRGSVPKGSPR